MSPIAELLGGRRIPRRSADASRLPTLATLAPGEGGHVDGLTTDVAGAEARRLLDLGFLPGAAVRVVRRPPWRDPVIVRVAGYDLALRQAQARHIRVRCP